VRRPATESARQRSPSRVGQAVTWVIGVGAIVAACGGPVGKGGAGSTDASATRGAEVFANNCARCHGKDLGGTDQGPPFLHEYYVPSHHGDGAFLVAVQRGVQPHHWDFGAMPPIEGLSQEDVEDIVAHVRQVQRDAGLIEGS